MNNNQCHHDMNDVVDEKLQDLMVPGFIAPMCPEEAELAGAFKEEALSEEDALEASNG